MNHPRRGVGLVEILVGIMILVMGLMPLFQIYRQSRTRVDTSQDMLLLQSHALQALAEGRAIVAAGELRQLDTSGEEVLERESLGVKTVAKISRIAGDRLLMVFVRAQSKDRIYETYQVVSDPFTSFVLKRGEED